MSSRQGSESLAGLTSTMLHTQRVAWTAAGVASAVNRSWRWRQAATNWAGVLSSWGWPGVLWQGDHRLYGPFISKSSRRCTLRSGWTAANALSTPAHPATAPSRAPAAIDAYVGVGLKVSSLSMGSEPLAATTSRSARLGGTANRP